MNFNMTILIIYLIGFVIAYSVSLWMFKCLFKKVGLTDIIVSLAIASLSFVGLFAALRAWYEVKQERSQKEQNEWNARHKIF